VQINIWNAKTSLLVIWIAANIFGFVRYLHFASMIWPVYGDNVGGPGDAFVWFLGSFPCLGFFVIANIIIFFVIKKIALKKQKYLLVICSLLALWIVIFIYDGIHYWL